MPRIKIDRLEFYITNVCNMTCSGCNRYNNYRFRGWQDWGHWEKNLESWATKINITQPVILGGEPLLNPTVVDWVKGLRKLWPPPGGVQIQSNGTMIDRVKGLYEVLDDWNWIGISIHSQDDKEEIFNRIRNFLVHPIVETQDTTRIGSDYQFRDANNKHVHCWVSDKFVQSNIIELGDNKLTVYNSDPAKAHDNCAFRKFKNYHWIKGKIYKCGPVALMPEFDQQHKFDITNDDRTLMNSYHALSVDEFDTRGLNFFNTIDDVIPQCKFCPEEYIYKPIEFSGRKKSWKISTSKHKEIML